MLKYLVKKQQCFISILEPPQYLKHYLEKDSHCTHGDADINSPRQSKSLGQTKYSYASTPLFFLLYFVQVKFMLQTSGNLPQMTKQFRYYYFSITPDSKMHYHYSTVHFYHAFQAGAVVFNWVMCEEFPRCIRTWIDLRKSISRSSTTYGVASPFLPLFHSHTLNH